MESFVEESIQKIPDGMQTSLDMCEGEIVFDREASCLHLYYSNKITVVDQDKVWRFNMHANEHN